VVEHIVVDGGSTDGTLAILEKYHGNIRYTSESDRGMSDALNKGFKNATGEVIGWLNSDDIYLPGTLQKVSDFFRNNPGCSWVYGNCRMVDEEDREVRRWITAYKVWKSKDFSYNRLLVENFISQPAVFFRKSAIEEAGLLDVNLPTAMDYDLWLRLARIGKPGYINDFLAGFRIHRGSISARSFRKQFEEQYSIHLRYDRNKTRLFKHRMMISVIVTVYTMMQLFRRVTS
jgi:GT2 family glycosyltransferase